MPRRLPFLRAALAISLAVLGAVTPSASHAAAPMVKTQAPGFYRMMLGAFEVTALSDGTVALPADALLHGPAGAVARHLKDAHLANEVETSITAYLVNTGERLVLIDAGTGALMGSTLGKLDGNLRAAGYRPEQVDDILITHAHPDHVGGLIAQGGIAFPNATVHIEQAEAAYWLSPERLARAPAQAREFFQGAMATLTPYADAGKLKPFTPGAPLLPGIRAMATHGHTVGHNVFAVESQGRRLLVIGDLIHVGGVQLKDPTITIAFDTDEPQAAATRIDLFHAAARDGTLLAATHLSFPGIGRLGPHGKSYQWMPVEYTTQFK